MSNQFKLTIEQVQNTSKNMSNVLTNMDERTSILIENIDSFLEDSWKGKSKEAFVEVFSDWKDSRNRLISNMGTLTKYLSNTKTIFKLFGTFDILDNFDVEEELHTFDMNF